MDAEQLRSLAGMRHRVLGAGGRFDVEAAAGQGNRITVAVARTAGEATPA
jgi:signal transduction histidine kinase